MKYKAIVEYEYPIEHKPPVKADIYLHGDKVTTREITPLRKGNWVEIDDYPHEDFECSCCGGQVFGTAEPYEEYKYCPNCGAEMGEK